MALIIQRGGFNIWPELLPFLASNLGLECFSEDQTQNTQNLCRIENSIHTISVIVEDC